MRQADVFLHSEGDAWLERNRDKLGKHDPVVHVLQELGITPTSVLEVGAADGRRLAKLRDEFGCKVLGIDPSMQACMEGAKRAVPMYQVTANGLPVDDRSVDLLIYGFCLYLTDPADWLRIAAEGDRVLHDGGHIVVHDFAASELAFARPYEHCDGILSYHFDFSELWTVHPLYHLLGAKKTGDDEMVTVIRKLGKHVIEVRP
jgi:ubiquinone/menaquinone biosynthesis C-methylase UbiE